MPELKRLLIQALHIPTRDYVAWDLWKEGVVETLDRLGIEWRDKKNARESA